MLFLSFFSEDVKMPRLGYYRQKDLFKTFSPEKVGIQGL